MNPEHIEPVGLRRYALIDKETQAVVKEGIATRAAARVAKRELEYKVRAANDFRNTPSRYMVETDIDHPAGGGIYIH